MLERQENQKNEYMVVMEIGGLNHNVLTKFLFCLGVTLFVRLLSKRAANYTGHASNSGNLGFFPVIVNQIGFNAHHLSSPL